MSSANSAAHSLPRRLLAVLRELPAPRAYLVALSGGLDSVVLLQAMAALRGELAAPLRAVHVDHGLHPDAPRWREHCRLLCRQLSVPLAERPVAVVRASRQSLEAQAREARYRALAEELGEGEMLLLAHHGDDQAETLFLQLLRGAGPRGLAAMPRLRAWKKGWMARPLLGFSREQLRAWALARSLAWLEDPSNRDLAIPRNYLRHEILPRLRRRWPAMEQTLGRSARHCAEAAELLEERAREDLGQVRSATAWQLSLERLEALPVPRRRNLLRHWMGWQGVAVPPARVLDTVLRQAAARADAVPEVRWKGGAVRRYRQRLYLFPGPLPEAPRERLLHWWGEEPLELPHGLGRLVPLAGRPAWFPAAGVEVAFDRRALRCHLAGRQGGRGFKALCQALGIPPWLRPLLPLLLVEGRLAALADYALCEPFAGAPGLRWERPEWLA